MLYEIVNGEQYKRTALKKLYNFCEKCPVLVTIANDNEGVRIIHKGTGRSYFFPWNYQKDIKAFIHEIKQTLIEHHYPRLVETIWEDHELSPEELAVLIEGGADIHSLPKKERRVVGTRLWRIDKTVLWKNVAILCPEPEDGKHYRFQMSGSLIIYMKRFRSGEWKTLEEAGTAFFNSASLINDVSAQQGDDACLEDEEKTT